MSRAVQSIVLFALVVLVALRPLVAERYESAPSSMTAALGDVSDPSPVATLLFDVVILASALVLALLRWRGGLGRYRKTGLEWGTLLVLVASIVSCAAASNRRLAINASIDWLCYPVLAIALVQLMTHRWQRSLLVAAVLASACAQSAKCFDDRFFRSDEYWQDYLSRKADFWAKQGVPLDSPEVELFERRMQSREEQGYLPHSNVAGSYFVLCAFAGLGLAVTSWRRRASIGVWRVVGPVIGVCVLAAVIPTTGSTGAALSAVAGLVLWLLVTVYRRWIGAHQGKALLIGWACVAAGAVAVVGHGLYHGSLPGASLNFRWQYWTTSAGMIADHGLTGVGRENFGRYYLHYKPIEASEEVSNPHNLFVQATAEWGVLGLAGVLVMLVGALRVITKPASPRADGEERAGRASPGRTLTWAAAVGGAILLARIPAAGLSHPALVFYETVTVGLAWGVGFWLFAPTSDTTPDRALGTGIAIGLFTFLLHDMINFAAFVPGTVVTLFALAAVCIAERRGVVVRLAEDAEKGPWWPVAASTAALLGIIFLGLLPVARTAQDVDRAEALTASLARGAATVDDVDRAFAAAADADPFDPSADAMRAAWWYSVAQAAPPLSDRAFSEAIASAREARARDPEGIATARLLARIRTAVAMHTGETDDYLTAQKAFARVVDLYPNDPDGRIALAESHVRTAERLDATGQAALAREHFRAGVDEYRRALELDNARPEWEFIRRMRDRERSRIEEEIRRIEARLA